MVKQWLLVVGCGLTVFVSASQEGHAGPLRRWLCGRRAARAPQKHEMQPRTCAGYICPNVDVAHHGSFCTYYSEQCYGTWTSWYGPHGHPTGDCETCTNCESATYFGRHNIENGLAKEGMTGPKPPVAPLHHNQNYVQTDPKGVVRIVVLPSGTRIYAQFWSLKLTAAAGGTGGTISIGHEVVGTGIVPSVKTTSTIAAHAFEVTLNGRNYLLITHHSTK